MGIWNMMTVGFIVANIVMGTLVVNNVSPLGAKIVILVAFYICAAIYFIEHIIIYCK